MAGTQEAAQGISRMQQQLPAQSVGGGGGGRNARGCPGNQPHAAAAACPLTDKQGCVSWQAGMACFVASRQGMFCGKQAGHVLWQAGRGVAWCELGGEPGSSGLLASRDLTWGRG